MAPWRLAGPGWLIHSDHQIPLQSDLSFGGESWIDLPDGCPPELFEHGRHLVIHRETSPHRITFKVLTSNGNRILGEVRRVEKGGK